MTGAREPSNDDAPGPRGGPGFELGWIEEIDMLGNGNGNGGEHGPEARTIR